MIITEILAKMTTNHITLKIIIFSHLWYLLYVCPACAYLETCIIMLKTSVFR